MGIAEIKKDTISVTIPSDCWHEWIPYLFDKPVVSGRVARWQMLLSEFDITYVTQKARKEQAIADHLAHLPLPSNEPVKTDFPDSFLRGHSELPFGQIGWSAQ